MQIIINKFQKYKTYQLLISKNISLKFINNNQLIIFNNKISYIIQHFIPVI